MIKIGIITTAILFMSAAAFCQTTGSIEGWVVDSLSGSALPNASILVYPAANQKPLPGLSSDAIGKFVVPELNPGRYRVIISFTGYRRKGIDTIDVSRKNLHIFLGSVRLTPSPGELQEVSITAKKPVMEATSDKLVYNVSADVGLQGASALDALRKSPGVSVDVDGNVDLRGNGNIRFLINGKPSTVLGKSITAALEGIPASSISKIEIIINPGSKYDAEGTAGIINIILKESKIKGTGGSISLSAGTRLETTALNVASRKSTFGVNAFFNATIKPLATVINTTDRQSFTALRDTLINFHQDRHSPIRRSSYTAGINFDWTPSKSNYFTGGITQSLFAFHGNGITPTDEQTSLQNHQLIDDEQSIRYTRANTIEKSTDINLGFKKFLGNAGQNFSLAYIASLGNNSDFSSQLTDYTSDNRPSFGQRAVAPGIDDQQTVSVDYALPIRKGFDLEAGSKLIWEKIHTNVSTDSLMNNGDYGKDAGQTYQFVFHRNIYAGYLSGSFSFFNDFISGKAGLRVEGTTSHASLSAAIPDNILFAPSLYIEHKFNEERSLSFAYSYRIERPDYGDLNPFVDIIDPHNLQTGDPLLKTEKGKKYELTLRSNAGKIGNFLFSLYYNRNTDDLQQLTTYYPQLTLNGNSYQDVTLSKAANVGLQITYGASLNSSLTLGNFESRTDVSLRFQSNRMPGLSNVDGFNLRLSQNVDYTLSHNIIIESFLSYTSKRTNFQSVRPALLMYTFAAKKRLINKKMDIGLIVTNPFNKYNNLHSSSFGDNFYQSTLRREPSRSFGISLSYRFGDVNIKSPKMPEANLMGQ